MKIQKRTEKISAEGEAIGKRNFSNPEEWVDKYGDYLFRVALLRLQDKQLAEDMVQETFLAALKAYGSFQGKSSERTWFVSILKRKIIDHYRKNSRLVPFPDEDNIDPVPDFIKKGDRAGRWKEGAGPQDWGRDPLKDLEHNQFHRVLQNCIAELNDNQAAAFTLREIDGKNTKEICKDLNISTSNLWVILHRARTQLRRCLEINWFSSKK